MGSKKYLQFAVLLFATTLLVGTVFAITNGVMVFGGTVRINSVPIIPDPIMRLEMTYTSAWVSTNFSETIRGNSEIVLDENGRQTLVFNIEILDSATVYYQWGAAIELHLENTGDLSVVITEFESDSNISHWGVGSIDSPLIRPGLVLQPDEVIHGTLTIDVGHVLELYRQTGEDTFNLRFTLAYEQAN